MEHLKQILELGLPLQEADKALIMLHGRGGTARDISTLKNELLLEGYYLAIPQATNNTWYPYSFLAAVEANEPWLSSAFHLLNQLVEDIIKGGIKKENIFILGFSQGACLALDFATRYSKNWGGVIAFTGGLIGEIVDIDSYGGSLSNTEVFIGNSDLDPHVPLIRSQESKQIMEQLGAKVNLKVYPKMSHTINHDEIDEANRILIKRVSSSYGKGILNQ